MDSATYARSVEYTLAKSRFGTWENLFDTGLLLIVLLSGFLPWLFERSALLLGGSVWANAAYLVAVMLAMAVVRLPLDWTAQFRLEEKFGFNNSTQATWWQDRIKGAVLLIVLLLPIFALLLKLIDWAGDAWWIWGWGCLMGIQFLMMILAPIAILPLFNKFTPLEDGALKDRLMALANRTEFDAREIQVMDGSRRSGHSNAFFTGFGKGRRIVLFDTLIGQLNEEELEAVLAHEIGHYKRRHILKMLAFSAVSLLLGFWVLSLLAGLRAIRRNLRLRGGESNPGLPVVRPVERRGGILVFALGEPPLAKARIRGRRLRKTGRRSLPPLERRAAQAA